MSCIEAEEEEAVIIVRVCLLQLSDCAIGVF